MSIESALKSAMELVDPTVIQLPYDGNRPTGNYMAFQPMIIVPQRAAINSRTLQDGGIFQERNLFHCDMTVSVNAYGVKGYQRLMQLHGLKHDYRARNLFGADNMALITVGSPRNLAYLGDEAYRERWQSDATFHVQVETSFVDYQLRRFVITGEWITNDDAITIVTDVLQIATMEEYEELLTSAERLSAAVKVALPQSVSGL